MEILPTKALFVYWQAQDARGGSISSDEGGFRTLDHQEARASDDLPGEIHTSGTRKGPFRVRGA